MKRVLAACILMLSIGAAHAAPMEVVIPFTITNGGNFDNNKFNQSWVGMRGAITYSYDSANASSASPSPREWLSASVHVEDIYSKSSNSLPPYPENIYTAGISFYYSGDEVRYKADLYDYISTPTGYGWFDLAFVGVADYADIGLPSPGDPDWPAGPSTEFTYSFAGFPDDYNLIEFHSLEIGSFFGPNWYKQVWLTARAESITVRIAQVPVPSTLLLLVSAFAALALVPALSSRRQSRSFWL